MLSFFTHAESIDGRPPKFDTIIHLLIIIITINFQHFNKWCLFSGLKSVRFYINYLLFPHTRHRLNCSWSEIWNTVNYGSVGHISSSTCNVFHFKQNVDLNFITICISACLFTSAYSQKQSECIFWVPARFQFILLYIDQSMCVCVYMHVLSCLWICVHTYKENISMHGEHIIIK